MMTVRREMGTYAIKNQGIKVVHGSVVALQDNNEWSYFLKRQVQLLEMKYGAVYATYPCMQMAIDVQIMLWQVSCYEHFNPTFVMLQQKVVEETGTFDRSRQGWKAMVPVEGCPNIMQHRKDYLANSSVMAVDEHLYSHVHLAYTRGWVNWCLDRPKTGEPIITHDGDRPFPVQLEIPTHWIMAKDGTCAE